MNRRSMPKESDANRHPVERWLALSLSRLVRVWRARLVCTFTWLARTLGWLDRMGVVSLIGRDFVPLLVLLLCHDRHRVPFYRQGTHQLTNAGSTSGRQG